MSAPVPTLTCDDGTERELPWRWAICPTCQGRGSHSLHLGAITMEDRRVNWSDDEFEDYVDGQYDQPCGCESGKVRVVDAGLTPPADYAAWQQQLDDEVYDERVRRAEMGIWDSGY